MTRLHQPTSRPGQLGRRGFLRGSAALAGTLGLSACGPIIGGGGPTSLRYWNLFGGGDGVRMVGMQEDYQRDYPEVAFEGVTLTWGDPYYTKLAMSSAGGRAPDVAISHLTRLPSLAPGSLLDPFDLDLLAEVGVSEDDFLSTLWDTATFDGEVYAVPLDSHPLVLFYNTDLCEQAGLLDGDGRLVGLEGEDAVLEAFQRGAEAAGGHGVALAAGDSTMWRLFWALYNQLDGEMELPEGGDFVIDQDKAVRALEFLHAPVAQGVSSPNLDYPGAVADFASGNSAFHINGEWEITTFQTAKLPFSMALLPQVFDNRSTQGDAHTFILPHQRDRDPQRTRTSYEFIAHMLKNSLAWAEGGHVPAYQPVATSAEYLALEPQSAYREAAETMRLDPLAWFSGSASDFESQAIAAFTPVFNGSAAPEAGLAQYTAAVNRLLDTPSPV